MVGIDVAVRPHRASATSHGLSGCTQGYAADVHAPATQNRSARGHAFSPGQRAAIEWLRAAAADLDELPRPGRGDTLRRWRALIALGAADLPRARLAEGHLDARAIVAELGDAPRPGAIWGVWTAEPARVCAVPVADGWHLTGVKGWCSGATALDAAIVSATAADGPRLFVLDPSELEAVPGTWPATGMEETASFTLRFDVVVSGHAALGPPGAYVSRPGFWHGGAGVAACWFGGSVGLADWLRREAQGSEDRSVRAAWGRVSARLRAAGALLTQSAREIDESPLDVEVARRRALTLRLVIQESAEVVLAETTTALGAGALAHDRDYARRIADLQLYIRQLRAEPTAAELGTLTDLIPW